MHYKVVKITPFSVDALPDIAVAPLFRRGDTHCVRCGRQPTHILTYTIAKEKHKYSYQGVFAGSNVGERKRFTADHILPRSLGGIDELSNQQVMCGRCNHEKSNTLTPAEIATIKANKSLYMNPNLTVGNMKAIVAKFPKCEGLTDLYGLTGDETDMPVEYRAPRRPITPGVRKRFAKMKAIVRETGGLVDSKHPHHPMLGWYRLFKQFPELRKLIVFKSAVDRDTFIRV